MNESTIRQARRLFAAGCPDVHLGMAGHIITFEPIPLGRLWDIAHSLDIREPFTPELASEELTEAIVAAIEEHYRNQ